MTMRKSKVAARIREGKTVRLAMLGHFIPPYIAYAADAGFDGIWLDLEHRAMDSREVQALLAFFHHFDIDCLIRTSTRERAQLYRYLEDGATGLIMPHVPDVETAQYIVNAVKFPPIGDRGIEGRGFETDFGLSLSADRGNLVDHSLEETVLMIQIETPSAAENAADIAALAGVDMLFVGPGDMGVRLRQMPEYQHLTLDDMYKKVDAACKQHGKIWGSMPKTVDDMKHFQELGAQIQIWGNDLIMLKQGLQDKIAELNALLR